MNEIRAHIERSAITVLSLLLGAASAPAQTSSFGLDIPKEYYDLPTAGFEAVFSQAGTDSGRCWKAYMNGRNLGYNFAKSLSPSCEELILPLAEGSDNEWTVPAIIAQKGENVVNLCNRLGYAAGFETTILNTSLYCSQQYEASVVNAVQLEYNRCYKSIASEAILQGASFVANSSLLPNENILVPKESAGWQSFVDSITKDENSPLLQNACRIAISHAERKQDPINFAEGTRLTPAPVSQIIYNGETEPFRIGQAWDAFKSNVVESSSSPFSGSKHLRATLTTDNNWWGAAAYIPHAYEKLDLRPYKTLKFQAKSDRPMELWVYLVTVSPNDRVTASLESHSVKIPIDKTYRTVEIPISSFREFPLQETQGIVFGVSVEGIQKYVVDIDDLQIVK